MNTFRQNCLAVAMLLVLSLALPSQAEESAPAETTAKQGSAIFDWEKLAVKTTANGARREVTDLPTATLHRFESHITTLNPGMMSHPPHKHAQEEFIILKEGTLDVSINGKVSRAGPGSLLFFAANDLHNVQNVGDKPATYLVFNLTTGSTKKAPAEGATAAAVPGKLTSRVYEWDKLEVRPMETGTRRDIMNSPTVTCVGLEGHVTTLTPGKAAHPPHRHGDEEIVAVKEGQIEVSINGVAQTAGPGSIFFYASNDEHGMKNVGTGDASYYVFRVVTESTPSGHPIKQP